MADDLLTGAWGECMCRAPGGVRLATPLRALIGLFY
jgi:hypothetical protein